MTGFDDDWTDELEAALADDSHACTHCGGDGVCDDGADPLGNCPDDAHRCHACAGTGDRAMQRIF